MSDDFNKAIEEIFDVTPKEVTKEPSNEVTVVPAAPNLPAVVSKPSDCHMEEDYTEVRQNYQDIIAMGKEAISDMKDLAGDMQHPRAYEVLGGLIKNVIEANEKFIGLHKTMRDMDGKKDSGNKTTIDKAIFVGSTAELSKLLKQKKEEAQ
jgi:hypothetical protein